MSFMMNRAALYLWGVFCAFLLQQQELTASAGLLLFLLLSLHLNRFEFGKGGWLRFVFGVAVFFFSALFAFGLYRLSGIFFSESEGVQIIAAFATFCASLFLLSNALGSLQSYQEGKRTVLFFLCCYSLILLSFEGAELLVGHHLQRLIKQGDYRAVLQLTDSIKRANTFYRSASLKEKVFSFKAQAYLALHQADSALLSIRRIPEKRRRSSFLLLRLEGKALQESGELVTVCSLMQGMVPSRFHSEDLPASPDAKHFASFVFQLFLHCGDFQSGKVWYQRYGDTLLPDTAMTPVENYSLGKAFNNWGMPEKALPFLQKSLQSGGNIPDLFYQLGVAYEKEGETEKAKRFYTMCLKGFPEHRKAAEALKRFSDK